MKFEEIEELITLIDCPPYRFAVHRDERFAYLQARYDEPCVVTMEMSEQATRKWNLSPHMTRSEIVQTALKCALTSAEHRVREHFTYKGELVYTPHWDVEALYELAKANHLDLRAEWPKPMAATGD